MYDVFTATAAVAEGTRHAVAVLDTRIPCTGSYFCQVSNSGISATTKRQRRKLTSQRQFLPIPTGTIEHAGGEMETETDTEAEMEMAMELLPVPALDEGNQVCYAFARTTSLFILPHHLHAVSYSFTQPLRHSCPATASLFSSLCVSPHPHLSTPHLATRHQFSILTQCRYLRYSNRNGLHSPHCQ